MSLLEFNPKAKVVDLGCGSGNFTLKVKQIIGCDEIYGVDGDKKALDEAKTKSIITKKIDLNKNFPFVDNFFDVVISNQVIEHLFYPIKFLKEIQRILKPGAYAVISTENLASWDNIFAITLGWTPFSMEFDEGVQKIGNPLAPHEQEILKNYLFPHIRIFTYRGLIESIKFVGFKLEKVKGGGHILFKIGEVINKKNCRYITIKVRK